MDEKWLVERQKQARRLLEWWEETNHPEDRDSGLAIDTRKWLAWLTIEVPEYTTGNDLYAGIEDEGSSSPPPPKQGRSDTKVHDPSCERCHDLSRMAQSGVDLDDESRSTASNPRTHSDTSGQQVLSRMD